MVFKEGSDIWSHVKDAETWLRLAFMLLFAVFFVVARFVLFILVAFQFLCHLFTGKANDRALAFGAQLAVYIQQIVQYLTYNSEVRPFPFADWPQAAPSEIKQKRSRPHRKAAAKKEAAGD